MDENILNDSWEPKGTTSDEIKKRIKADKARFWAGDNISKYLEDGDKENLIEELAPKFDSVIDSLVIDREHDPNSTNTGRRLAKMYINELMAGRYDTMPNATAFPQEMAEAYTGILTIRSELKSVCSHHHQPVSGIAYIGILAAEKLIGLSKYTRIAQWCARRGTLQEELCNNIAREIMKATGSNDVGVYIQATHGCCENRGIMAYSSLTQTTVLKGAFKDDKGTKQEFFDNIKLQQEFAPR
jgi:GTP cyclohydrolase I